MVYWSAASFSSYINSHGELPTSARQQVILSPSI